MVEVINQNTAPTTTTTTTTTTISSSNSSNTKWPDTHLLLVEVVGISTTSAYEQCEMVKSIATGYHCNDGSSIVSSSTGECYYY